MSRIIELRWKCKNCGTEDILGRHKSCPSCSSPREKGEMKMDGLGTGSRNSAPTVTDPELIRLATAGADWFCSHCESGNKGDGNQCSSCGSNRYAVPEEDHPDFQGDHARIQRVIQSDAPEISRPESSDDDDPPDVDPSDADPVQATNWSKTFFIGGGISAALMLIAFIFWALQTHDVTGSVVSMKWTRTVHAEQWSDTTVRLWKHQTSERPEIAPRNGSGERAGISLVRGTCRSEHFDDEQYVSGQHEECHDVYRTEHETYSCSKSEEYVCGETCTDNGNGFASCSNRYCTRSVSDTCTRSVQVFDHKDCRMVDEYSTRPIFKDKCTYATQEWRSSGTYPTSGEGKVFKWGAEPVGDEVRRFYSAIYTTTISYTDRGKARQHAANATVTRTTKSAAEAAASTYSTRDVGQPVLLSINNLGGVHQAAPITDPRP